MYKQLFNVVRRHSEFGTLCLPNIVFEKNVLDVVRVIIFQHDRTNREMRLVEYCEAGEVCKQLLRLALIYMEYVNRKVWNKN